MKPTYVERLLEKVRKKPSPTCPDRRQLELSDYIKRQAFAKLDEAIRVEMKDSLPPTPRG